MSLEQLGAAEFVDFGTSKDLVADVKNATEDGLGPHAVILVAVNEKPFQQAAEVRLYQSRKHAYANSSPVRTSTRDCSPAWTYVLEKN